MIFFKLHRNLNKVKLLRGIFNSRNEQKQNLEMSKIEEKKNLTFVNFIL